MPKIKIMFPPIRTLLSDPEMNKFRRLLDDAEATPAIEPFLDALDRPDVALGMLFTPAFGIPGIVAPCLALKGNRAFEDTIEGNDNLKRCLGTLTKLRAISLGLDTTGRKGRVGQWMSKFTVAEIYAATEQVWSALSFNPGLPKEQNVFGVLDPQKEDQP